jgi:hypothetical protein
MTIRCMPTWSLVVALASCSSASKKPKEYPSLSAAPTEAVVAERRTAKHVLPEVLVKAIGDTAMYVEDFRSLMLFADERAVAQQIIAQWAANAGIQILPVEKVNRFIAQGINGMDPTTGKTCGPRMSREFAIDRWMPTLSAGGAITANVYCHPDCELQVEFRLNNQGTEFYAAPFDVQQPWQQELAKRLDEVADNGGHDQHGHLNNPVAVKGVAHADTPDLLADRDVAMLPTDLKAAVTLCKPGDDGLTLLVDTSSNGPLRCEHFPHPQFITEWDPDLVTCACDAAKKFFKPASADRGRQALVFDGATRQQQQWLQTKNGKWVTGDAWGGSNLRQRGAAWFIPGVSDVTISKCFTDRSAVIAPQDIDSAIFFDAQGVPTKMDFDDPTSSLSATEKNCVTTLLKAARSPCPDKLSIAGEARIRWEVRDHAP